MFQKEWENEFLFSVNVLNKIACLVCYREIKNITHSGLKRHYENCHSQFLTVAGNERAELVKKLKDDFRIYYTRILYFANNKTNNSLDSQPSVSSVQLKASYAVALALAKNVRPFEDGDFFKEMCLSVLQLFGVAGLKLEALIVGLPLSAKTITRRTDDIGEFLKSETNQRIKNAKYISLCIDESVNQDRSRNMIICIKTVDNDFRTVEEFLKLESLSCSVSGKDIHESFERNIVPLINVKKLSAIWVDGGPLFVGENEGFVRHLLKSSGIEIPIFQRIMLKQSLFSKTIGLKESVKMAGSIVKRLGEATTQSTKSNDLNLFLTELNTEFGDCLSLAEVKWLSRGKILQRLLELRGEIIIFLEAQDDCPDDVELLNSLNNSKFLLDLAFLCDITVHFNNLNTVLQGKENNMCDALHAFNQFSRRLQLLASQIESQNMENFPHIRAVINQFPCTNSVSVLGEELETILDDFRSRFQDFAKIEWILNIYNDPLTCSSTNFPTNIQLELSVMRQDPQLPLENGIDFWKNICPVKYPETRDVVLKLYSMFSTTQVSDSILTTMVQIKGKFRRNMTSNRLDTLLRIKCYNEDIDLEKVMDFNNANGDSNGTSSTSNIAIKNEPIEMF